MTSITDLPPEIILRIFNFYLQTESQKDFFLNLSFVCESWKNICANRLFWRKFDGTLPFKVMMQLCDNGCLNNTKDITVSNGETFTEKQEKKLFSSLKNVEVIDLSQISKFSKNTLLCITANCTKLEKFIIGKITDTSLKLNCGMLEPFFNERGDKLTKLQMNHCFLANLPAVFSCITKSCPNLEEFNVINIMSVGTFPTRQFQEHCPKLKVLHLDHHLKVSENKHSAGFPNLEVFTYVDARGYWITDKSFNSIAFNSPNLKFLNLTNCYVGPKSLISLPAHSMEYLFIAKSKIIQERGLADVLGKWSHSLKQVDISHTQNAFFNRAVLNLAKANSQLEYLNVNFCKITLNAIEQILKSCIKLKELNLEGCRNLQRGMKRKYRGESEIENFSKKVRQYIADNPNEIVEIDLD